MHTNTLKTNYTVGLYTATLKANYTVGRSVLAHSKQIIDITFVVLYVASKPTISFPYFFKLSNIF